MSKAVDVTNSTEEVRGISPITRLYAHNYEDD